MSHQFIFTYLFYFVYQPPFSRDSSDVRSSSNTKLAFWEKKNKLILLELLDKINKVVHNWSTFFIWITILQIQKKIINIIIIP